MAIVLQKKKAKQRPEEQKMDEIGTPSSLSLVLVILQHPTLMDNWKWGMICLDSPFFSLFVWNAGKYDQIEEKAIVI